MASSDAPRSRRSTASADADGGAGRCRSRPAGTRSPPTGASCSARPRLRPARRRRAVASRARCVLPLGRQLGWISMVLVTKDRRRGGVGTGLLKRCIAELQAQRRRRRARRDASRAADLPAARLSDLYALSRWHFDAREGGAVGRRRAAADAGRSARAARLRPARSSGLARPTLAGASRGAPPASPGVAERRRPAAGFALGRDGRTATQIGPLDRRRRGDRRWRCSPGSVVGRRDRHHRRAEARPASAQLARSAGRRQPARLHADGARARRQPSTTGATSSPSPAPSWDRLTPCTGRPSRDGLVDARARAR